MAPDIKSKANAAVLAGLRVEMAKPRSTASANEQMPRRRGNEGPLAPAKVAGIRSSPGNIISAFNGVYKRVAHKLNVSPSLVSKVGGGSRKSVEVEAALLAELRILKEKLTSMAEI